MPPQKLKTVIVGEASVGKTCIVNRIMNDEFHEGLEATVGAANASVVIKTEDIEVEFNIWDTAGQERYRSLTPMYFSGAALAFLVYDVTSRKSFDALDTFYEMLVSKSPEYVKLVLIGNKADLANERTVTAKEGEDYAMSIGAEFYIECSAKTGLAVRELFERAANIPDLHFEKELYAAEINVAAEQNGPATGNKGCC